MKKKKIVFWILMAVVGVLIGYQMAQAGPFLTCDDYPLPIANQPDSFEVTITPLLPFIVPATTNANGTVKLYYDLAPATAISAGAHTASAVALKGGWRSAVSNSYPFTKPTLSAPNISIVGQ